MNMIERIARVLARNDGEPEAWPQYADDARAVLEEMREPTQDILSAGIRKGVDIGFGVGYPEYEDLYRAFIEAALKGEG